MLVTRQITNAGDPLCAPDGTILAGVEVTFVLTNPRKSPIDAWDAITFERVVGVKVAVTDGAGEFSVDLWPTDRSNVPAVYLCTADVPGAKPFASPVPSGAEPLSWAMFMAHGLPLEPSQLDFLDLYRAEFAAVKLAAENAAAAAGLSASDAAGSASQTAADRVQTGLDRQAAADSVAQIVGAGTAATDALAGAEIAAIAALTHSQAAALDRLQAFGARDDAQASALAAGDSSADASVAALSAAADRAQTSADRLATSGDRVQTGLDRLAAQNSAAAAQATASSYAVSLAEMATSIINTQAIIAIMHPL